MTDPSGDSTWISYYDDNGQHQVRYASFLDDSQKAVDDWANKTSGINNAQNIGQTGYAFGHTDDDPADSKYYQLNGNGTVTDATFAPTPLPQNNASISPPVTTNATAIIIAGSQLAGEAILALGGPENPVADAAAVVIEVGSLVYGGYKWLNTPSSGTVIPQSHPSLAYTPSAISVPTIVSAQGKGERGQTARPDGTNNPFKKLKPDTKKPGNVIQKDSHTGKTISKPAPPGFWEWWNTQK